MLIVFYLLISFRKWQYGLGAIAAVAHDVIFVLGFILYFTRLCLSVWKLTNIYSGNPYCYWVFNE
jgi:preprotein translocase subunit SecF